MSSLVCLVGVYARARARVCVAMLRVSPGAAGLPAGEAQGPGCELKEGEKSTEYDMSLERLKLQVHRNMNRLIFLFFPALDNLIRERPSNLRRRPAFERTTHLLE